VHGVRVHGVQVPCRGVFSPGVEHVRVDRLSVAVTYLHRCGVLAVGGVVAGHHVHAEEPGDDCEHRRCQGATLQERLGKTRIK
jgi:hypothetical protein